MTPRARRRAPSSPSRRSRRRTRAAAGLVALAVAVLAVPLSPAPDARAADGDAALAVASMSPDVAQPGGTLRLSGTVRAGADPIAGSEVRLRLVTAAVTTRDELAALVAGTSTRIGVPVASETTPVDLAPGAGRTWSLSVPLDSLGLGAAGVYPLLVDLDSSVTGITAVRTTTFLSWYPKGTGDQPTKVVWLVPMVGTPARDANGVFVNDATAADLAPGGRLSTLLAAVGGTSASWVVDPELLEAVQAMSRGYQVRTPDGSVVPGSATATADAGAFLASARRLLGPAEVSSLGYADPDVNALQRAGLTADLTLATTTGPTVASQVLGRRVGGTLAWPPGDFVDQPTLDTLYATGISSVVLSDQALPVDPSLTYTPTGLAQVAAGGGVVDAVLADSTLSTVIGQPALQGGDALARARYLAETLLITEERPSDSRTVVVAAPRDWAAGGAFEHALVTMAGRAPWIASSSLAALLAQPVPAVPRGSLTYPDAARAAELSPAQTSGARALGAGIATFTSILDSPAVPSASYGSAMLRTLSGAFRTQPAAGLGLLGAVGSDLASDRAKVSVLSRGSVTLSGANGQIPVTVANNLDQGVVVRVRLRAASPVKLRLDQPGDVALGAHRKQTLEIAAHAAAGGTVPVSIQLLTTAGTPYNDAVVIKVRSTAYSRVALAVVGVALLALLVIVAVRLGRRLRGVHS